MSKSDFLGGSKAVNEKKNSTFPKDGNKRLTFDIPEVLHRQLKIRALNEGKLMKDIIIDAIIKDMDN